MKKIGFIALVLLCLVGSNTFLGEDVYARELSAKKLLKKAKKGDKKRQYELAQKYQSGYKDIKQDVKEAFFWYQKAADQGHPKAQGMLGLYYKNGIGTEKDTIKAKEWYTKASANGHVMSDLNHGMLLLQEKDYSGSDAYFQKVIDSDSNEYLEYKSNAFYGRSEIQYAAGNLQDAYSWYVLAQISNAIRHNNPEDKPYIEKFKKYRNKLTPEQYKATLIKSMEYHYKYYVRYKYYLRTNKDIPVYKHTVIFQKNMETVGFIGYHTSRYRKINGAVNYFEDKMDRVSRINYAIWLLNQANSYLSHGSLWPNYYLAQNSLEKADKVFDEYYNAKEFKFLNEIVKEKAVLVADLAGIQAEIINEFRALNKKSITRPMGDQWGQSKLIHFTGLW